MDGIFSFCGKLLLAKSEKGWFITQREENWRTEQG
jgi:hypothetical protein